MLPLYLIGLKRLLNIGKKILLVIAVYFIVISLFIHFINKDRPKITSDPIKRNRQEIYKVINDPKLKKTTEGKLTIALYRATMCGLIGEACTDNPSDGDKNFSKSTFGLIGNLIILPYTYPPASGIAWAYNGLQEASFIPKTYAAEGIGFGAIKPFAKIWNAFRNVAYLVIVLVLITIGFMIMFRMKINPQTIISVENSLPKIVISLILITFSFAIAGFLIDLMYIAIILVVSIIGPVGGLNPAQVAQKQSAYLQADPALLFASFSMGTGDNIFKILWDLPTALLNLIPFVGGIVRLIGGVLGVYFIFPWLINHPPLKNIIEAVDIHGQGQPAGVGFTWAGLGKLLQAFPALVVLIIALMLGSSFLMPLLLGALIFLTVLFIFFRIIFLLLSAYIKILLIIIISPLYLLLEAIPGQAAFSSWLKNLVSELIIFPTIVTILMLVALMINAMDTTTEPTLIQFPFMVGIDANSFSLIIAMAILFLTPDFIRVIKQLFVPKPGLLDMGGLGLFFGGVTTGVSAGLGEASKWASTAYYFKPFGNLVRRLPFGKQLIGEAPHQT